MTAVVTVNISYTPPGMTEADSLQLEFQAPPGAHVKLQLAELAELAIVGQEGEQAPPNGGWKQAARKIVTEAGADVWLSTSAVRSRLQADGITIGRAALSTELGEMVGRGEIARQGSGAQTKYGASVGDVRVKAQRTHGGDWLSEAIEVIRQAGPAGLNVAGIAAGVDRDRKTIRPGLQACAESGRLLYRENGPRSAYVHPDHA